MTYLDGARFLIACAATDHPKRVADAEEVFSGTLFDRGSSRIDQSTIGSVAEEDAGATLDVALATVLESIGNGSLDRQAASQAAAEGRKFGIAPHLSLDVFRSGVSAVLRAGDVELRYSHPAQMQMHAAEHGDTLLALAAAWMRETDRFRSGKNLHATLDSDVLRAVADAIAGNPVNAERQSTVTEPGASAPGQHEDEA